MSAYPDDIKSELKIAPEPYLIFGLLLYEIKMFYLIGQQFFRNMYF